MKTKIKTIDIQAKEWFDRSAANSYFSANVTVNFGLPDAFTFPIPFQYGYDEHYIDIAQKELSKRGYLPNNDNNERLWRYCEKYYILLRTSKKENCLKKEVKAFSI